MVVLVEKNRPRSTRKERINSKTVYKEYRKKSHLAYIHVSILAVFGPVPRRPPRALGDEDVFKTYGMGLRYDGKLGYYY